MTNIERFKKYLEKKGYALEFCGDFRDNKYGVSCSMLGINYPKELARDFTQTFCADATTKTYTVRLSQKDFDNAAITENLF